VGVGVDEAGVGHVLPDVHAPPVPVPDGAGVAASAGAAEGDGELEPVGLQPPTAVTISQARRGVARRAVMQAPVRRRRRRARLLHRAHWLACRSIPAASGPDRVRTWKLAIGR
jgi:hypothetical protein